MGNTTNFQSPLAKSTMDEFRLDLASGYLLFCLLLLPIRSFSPFGVSSFNYGLVVSLAVVPMAFFAVRDRLALTAAVGFAGVLIGGVVTPWLFGGVARPSLAYGQFVFFLNAFAMLCVALVARNRLRIRVIVSAVALGFVVQALLSPESWSAIGGWKYAFAWPISALLLAWVRGPGTQFVALIALIATGVLSDSRSAAALTAVVALVVTLVYLTADPRESRSALAPRRSLFTLGAALVVGFAMYFIGVQLALAGYLGERNMEVTQAQIDRAGSVLLSARPEWQATIVLADERLVGYGFGVMPSAEAAARSAAELLRVGVVSEGYVDDYVFGANGVSLHSVAADLWYRGGIPGAVFAGFIFVNLVRALIAIWRNRLPDAFSIYILVVGLWDLFFSPSGSNIGNVMMGLVVAVCLLGRGGRTGDPVLSE